MRASVEREVIGASVFMGLVGNQGCRFINFFGLFTHLLIYAYIIWAISDVDFILGQ
jgi:hypothetical protein